MTLRAIAAEYRSGLDGGRLAGTLLGFGVNAIEWIAHRLDQGLCGIRGHEDVMHYQRTRLSLRCVRCGRQTRGWDLTVTPPRPARTITFPKRASPAKAA